MTRGNGSWKLGILILQLFWVHLCFFQREMIHVFPFKSFNNPTSAYDLPKLLKLSLHGVVYSLLSRDPLLHEEVPKSFEPCRSRAPHDTPGLAEVSLHWSLGWFPRCDFWHQPPQMVHCLRLKAFLKKIPLPTEIYSQGLEKTNERNT